MCWPFVYASKYIFSLTTIVKPNQNRLDLLNFLQDDLCVWGEGVYMCICVRVFVRVFTDVGNIQHQKEQNAKDVVQHSKKSSDNSFWLWVT